jgi:tRNA(fMet)-specific endonuclease VapC
MNGTYLLDTNALIAVIDRNQALVEVIGQAREIFIPVIALGELYFGAEKSRKKEHNLEQIAAMIVGRTILECDVETARWYGRIRQQLRAKGRPIPENDLWIAALACQHKLTLLPRQAL